MMMIRRYTIIFSLLALGMTGCKKFVNVDAPIDQIPSFVVFDDDTKAAAAMRGIYVDMVSPVHNPFAGSISSCTGLAGDELITTSSLVDFTDFQNNQVSSSNAKNSSGLWGGLYGGIYHANAVLAGISNSPKMTEAAKAWIGAETRFCRALFYFYLVNMYGPVPMPVTTDYNTNTFLHRTSVDSVYDLITEDLLFAQATLGNDYTSGNKVRANKWAATALLARVYLYRGNYQAAIEQATAVINAGYYSLEPLASVFLLSGKEQILQISSAGTNLYTWDAYIFATLRTHLANPLLVNSFETADQRKAKWLLGVTIAGTAYSTPSKYKITTGTGTAKTEATSILRLGEQYLIRAEAYAHTGDLAAAKTDVDSIRHRAGLPYLVDGLTKEVLLDTILHERRVELFSELGHRWMDVKRSGKANVIFGSVKNSWDSTDVLFPVPLTDLQRDKNLYQNPGYN